MSTTGGLLLVLLFAGVGSPAEAQEGTPKLVVAERSKEVGDVPRGEVVHTTFVLENAGDAELVFHAASTDCECAVIDYDERIAPGARSEVKVALDTLILQGPRENRLILLSNDPETPRLELFVRSNTVSYITGTPGYARYRVVQGFVGEGTVTQTLWSTDGANFSIERAESPLSALTVSFRPATAAEREAGNSAAGSQWVVETTLDPMAPVGALQGWVKLFVDHPKQKIVPLPLSGFVRPVFAVTPNVADFGSFELAEPLSQAFKVKNFASEPIVVTEATTDLEGAETVLQTVMPGREYVVWVIFREEMAEGPFTGTLKIQTSSERSGVLTVPLSGTRLPTTSHPDGSAE